MTDLVSPIDLAGGIDPASPLLALNNAHAEELSLLDAARMGRLVGEAFMAARLGEADALLMAFDQDADYDSPNFIWFRDRYERFVYVDRVVVDPAQRGRGLARRLYEALFARAAAGGHTLVVCEVNAEPPNPASDAFHAALGFAEVGYQSESAFSRAYHRRYGAPPGADRVAAHA
jgi:predicted GNAT superfamily acetyltransferase